MSIDLTPKFGPLEFHPIANIFPLLEGDTFRELVDDIALHGVREPVWLLDGKILDGRNRYRASAVAGVHCPIRAYEGDDPVSFVVSLNLRRRHLSESQRAMAAAKIADLPHGTNQWSGQLAAPTQAQAATMLNVGERSLRRAREVLGDGAAELVSAVERGAVSVSAAADIATKPQEEQREIVARGEREILEAAKAIRADKAEARHAQRIAKLTEISAGNAALPSGRKYPIIYADPPWERPPGISTDERRIDNHYPTMPTADICQLPVGDLATTDAVLFLWITSPHLEQAFEVIKAWGFEYRTGVVWMKDKIGTGYWVRNQHELLLIASRGAMPHPLPANRPSSVITAPRREHSRKPDEAYELIERMYPGLPKIELFARQARAQWDLWGNQAPALTEDVA